uniref:Rho GTPase activating protein 28 n=1 Tax=Sinocyclocheilus grahami TaxID=75366 RepID=A0A672M7Z9_SINGR
MHLMQTLMGSVSLCFCRKAQYQRIGSMSLERDSMEDYWSEMKSIDEERQGGPEEQMERVSVDEAELEEAWLQEAGLSTLATGTQSDGPAEALLSTLTHSQAAMVKKRLDNYTQTLRKRNRQPMRHVRDVFSMSDASSELTPPISPNGQIAPKLPQWNPPKADTNGSSSASETILLSFDVPYSEAARAHRKGRECQDCRRIRKDDRDLPSFQIVRPRQGVTRVSDLSSEDIKKIGYISLIELTTFYDFMGIEMKRNRVVRSKARDSGIFGVPLTTLLENDQKKYPGSRVPLVFKKLLSKLEQTGLQTEGILRVPGSASRVKHLRQELELKFYEDRFDWDRVRQNDAAGLLKMFIRELPYPLLTQQHLPAFTAAQSISSPKHQIQALHLLIMLLPEANRDTLKLKTEIDKQVQVMLRSLKSLFSDVCSSYPQVPCFLISHVRKMYEAAMGKKLPTSEKSKSRLLKRWSTEKERERSEVTDLRDGVIRVHAPLHAKVTTAIQLNAETKRCLDPDAHLLDVYRVNPHCEWVLKSRLT